MSRTELQASTLCFKLKGVGSRGRFFSCGPLNPRLSNFVALRANFSNSRFSFFPCRLRAGGGRILEEVLVYPRLLILHELVARVTIRALAWPTNTL